jgi:hypothetical protein
MPRTPAIGAVVASALGLLFACSDADKAAPAASSAIADAASPGTTPPPSTPNDSGSFGDASSGEQARVKVDILVIVDDSGSMEEEQKSLASRFDEVTTSLGAFTGKNGAKLDYRIAVTTTGRTQNYKIETGLEQFPDVDVHDKGDDGHFRKGCTMTRPWLEWTDSDVGSNFACIAKVGTTGPSIEMPLESMKLALVDRIADGSNGTFLRTDALLSVIVVTDADDCSRTDDNFTIKDDSCVGANAVYYEPVADYITVLDSLKGGRDRWAFAAIAAPTACQSTFGDAEPATRLQEFVTLAGKNAVLGSICSGDLQGGLDAALNTFDALWKTVEVR